ncbi:double zinc ribbon [Lucifera butyrica]|uniref:Double zinc ribbon n=1 Tax=Lucifera butyrica TaxID=1351585 RepID=A0A498R7D2_9FIRM|nr:zinc ribbon domain-containing protein [Lucifera butyrica]VBB07404.1 double zinc ribbon [Lucifera butyrica]
MTTIGLAIALVAAYWVYTDARSRGQTNSTALMWAAGVLAALIIFLPLYLVVGRKQMPRAHRDENVIDVEATVVENTVHCPMCGNRVQEDFKICPYCGHTLKPKCQNCGREINREWKTCPYCQTPTPDK